MILEFHWGLRIQGMSAHTHTEPNRAKIASRRAPSRNPCPGFFNILPGSGEVVGTPEHLIFPRPKLQLRHQVMIGWGGGGGGMLDAVQVPRLKLLPGWVASWQEDGEFSRNPKPKPPTRPSNHEALG